jgi:ribosomal protein L32E
LIPIRVENVAELSGIQKGQGVIVGRVGKRNRKEIIAKANEMKLTILNKYKVETK